MAKYRKKPIVIEAIQFTGKNPLAIHAFVGDSFMRIFYTRDRYQIRTLEGDIEVSKDDYVIKGVKGEFYPCKPDIFEATYEAVE